MRGSTGMTGGTSHSSIRPTSDIGRLLIQANPFHAGGIGARGRKPTVAQLPARWPVRPPGSPPKIERPPGEALLMAHRSSFRLTPVRRSSPSPASRTSTAYQPAFPPGGGSVVAAAITNRIRRALIWFSPPFVCFVRVNRELQMVRPRLPASLATRGRKRRCGGDHEQDEKSTHGTPRLMWGLPFDFCLPNLRRLDVKAVVVPFAIWG